LLIREKQIKTTVRYHFILIKVITSKDKKVSKDVKKSKYLFSDGKNVKWCTILWKTFWQFLKKTNIKLLYGPRVLLLDVHLKELKIYMCTKSCA
jgi:hypothetical protein